MRRPGLLLPLAATTVLAGALLAPVAAAGSTPATGRTGTVAGTPQLVAYRAAHHPGYDRVVFEFHNGLPARTRLSYVNTVYADGSGQPVRIAGAAKLAVVFENARAHTAAGEPTIALLRTTYALPGVHEVVRTGDFEGYLSFGIGLSKATKVRTMRLTKPYRVVLDIPTSYRVIGAKAYFMNERNFDVGREPYTTAVARQVATPNVLSNALHRLFAGPTPAEKARGLRVVLSGATGFSKVTLSDRVARVYLTGAVSSGGSTFTIASLIMPTLEQFPSVRWVKIYDQNGRTERPTGHSDSIPESLEP